MADDKALWWKAFDAAEKAVAPRLEAAVSSGTFAEALSLVARVDHAVRNGLEARSRSLWHAVNLPAGSDVVGLRRQIVTLDRELRRVSLTLERVLADQHPSQEEVDADDRSASGRERPARPQRAAGPRSPGRRAQRAARP